MIKICELQPCAIALYELSEADYEKTGDRPLKPGVNGLKITCFAVNVLVKSN